MELERTQYSIMIFYTIKPIKKKCGMPIG
jgi:hypothetical protein